MDASSRYAPFFRKAFALSEQGRGGVEPNPLVGALVLAGDEIVGRGFHGFYGGPHAEIEALREAKGRGDTLLVTLEPCSTQGKTPPCTWAIVDSSIRRVVIGARDPFPGHQGAAVEILEKSGRELLFVDFQKEWEQRNRPFLKALKLPRPWVIAKWAMTLDGKTASADGDSKWVSGEPAREEVWTLRGRCEAVAVGVGTVLQDDPMLTARDRLTLAQPPLRVVFDSQLRTPLDAKIVSGREARTLFVTSADAPKIREERLLAAGCEVLRVPGRAKRPSIPKALEALRERGVRRLLLEGGGELAAAFLDAGCIDQITAYVAPKLLGGEKAKTALGGKGLSKMAKALSVTQGSWSAVGDDLRFVGFL